MISGAIGMPVGAIIATFVGVLLLAEAHRRGLLDPFQGSSNRLRTWEGLLGSTIVSLVNLSILAVVFARLTEPWWLYLGYWVLAVALPLPVAAVWFNMLGRRMGDDWYEFVQRRRSLRELPPRYKRAFRQSIALALLPGVVVGLLLFAPDM